MDSFSYPISTLKERLRNILREKELTQNCWETGLRGERNKDLERLEGIGEAFVCVNRGEKR